MRNVIEALPRGSALATCVAVVLAMTVAPIGAGVALGTHDEDRTTQGFKTYTPGGEIPNPGESYSVELYMTPAFMDNEGPIPPEAEVRVEYIKYYSTTKSHCGAQDVYALGIDRGNDLPGTKYDEDMLQKLMQDGDYQTGPGDDPAQMTTNDDWTHRHVNWMEFPQPDDFTEPLLIHEGGQEDELIVATEECVEMPDVGWHRTFGYMNGTIEQFHDDRDSITIDGEEYEEGDHFEIWEPADWYPVCDCQESRHVAMRLDPPPGKMTRGSEGGIYHPNGTIEAPYAEVTEDGTIVYPDTEVAPDDVTAEGIYFEDGFLELTGPIYYGAGMVEEDGTIVTPQGERIEPEEDRSRDPPTPTQTPSGTTDDGGEGSSSTPSTTATLEPSDDDEQPTTGTATADPGPGADSSEGDSDGDDGGAAAAAAGDNAGDTPSPGDGPGFGVAAALAAVLAVAVYLGRTR